MTTDSLYLKLGCDFYEISFIYLHGINTFWNET